MTLKNTKNKPMTKHIFGTGLFRKLRRNDKGGVLIEFALVAPVLCTAVLGALELGMVMISSILIEGAISDASRAGITGYTVSGTAREQYIKDIVKNKTFGMVEVPDLTITYKIYKTFGAVATAEPYVDVDLSGDYTAGTDKYTDINCNNNRDADIGISGVGGPGDIVVYKVEYDSKFITGFFSNMMGNDGKIKLAASTAVKNEPYDVPPPGCVIEEKI
jgi:Flp pilus assembly protein TadG